MAHELEIRNGVACMMYAGETPWHKLGQKVEKEVTAAAAIKLAGMDTVCEPRDVFIGGTNQVDGIPVIGQKVPNIRAIVRTCDNKVLGTVGDRYSIIQNQECFDFMDDVIGSGQAVYHTAGSLRGGRQIFLTVKFPNTVKIGDDTIEKYLLLTSSHDGSQPLEVRQTPIRVVCANTMGMALQDKTQNAIKIRHTTNYRSKIEHAREVLQATDQYYNVMEEEFNRMLDAEFSNGDMNEFVAQLLPVEGTPSTRTKNLRNKIVELYHVGKGNAAVTGTRWAALNAVTEYTDHFSTIRNSEESSEAERRMLSSVYGTGQDLKQRAFDLLKVDPKIAVAV